MTDCIFCKIAKKELEKDLVFETEEVVVFSDLHPLSPIHLLIVPKVHVKEFALVEDPVLFSSLSKVVQEVIKMFDLEDKGYRIVINGGGAQDIDHLHFHLRGPVGKPTN